MASCSNPKTINTTNVDQFGFTVVFDPYNKKATFDISGLTIFSGGGQANISNVTFVLTDPLNEEHTLTIDPSNNELDGEITGLSQASLFFGVYNVVATLTEADASVYTINQDYNVCHDARLTAQNYIASTSNGQSCIEVNVDCGRAIMDIYNKANMKYAGMQPITADTTYLGTITYPDDYQEKVTFTFAPYQLNLTDSITGMYQVSLLVTAYYDLGCEGKLAIQYRGKVNRDVQCGASMCDLNCCWQDALDIVSKGGSAGAQMEEKMQLASYWYNAAVAQWSCGHSNDYEIAKVKEILNCDCKCQKAILIQPRPITYAGKNLIGSCGTTITEDENGDYLFHSFVYQVSAKPGDGKIITTTVQTSDCTKTTYIELDCYEIQACILEVIGGSDAVLQQWQDVLGISSGCPCDDVTITNAPILVEVTTLTDDFDKLADTNFVKNDVVTGVKYDDGTTIVGGTFDSAEYHDQVIQQSGLVTTQGAEFTLPCSVCGGSLIGQSGKLISSINTTCSCRKSFQCDITIDKVDYSERYATPYRFNPQIDDAPVISGNEIIDGVPYETRKLIFADSYTSGVNEGDSYIREMKFIIDSLGNVSFAETRTLFGAKSIGSPTVTYNNIAGNQVNFDRASAINLDFSEIVNGYPVMYFVTFGGAICRAVRANTGNCDERANWVIYVIRDLQSPSKVLYGMKKWYVDENGNQTFMYYNNTDADIVLFNYIGVGSKNDPANWASTIIGNITISGNNANFNIEVDRNYIFTYGTGEMKLTIYSGTNSLADLQNNANYTQTNIANGGASASEISYIDATGATATVWKPYWLQKVTVGAEERYYFGNTGTNALSNYQQWSYLRYFVKIDADPASPASWEFHTDIVVNTNSILADGTWVTGVSTNANGMSLGMCEVPDYGWVSLNFFGAKLFDFDASSNEIITGQAALNGDLDDTNPQMDTQWSYNLEC